MNYIQELLAKVQGTLLALLAGAVGVLLIIIGYKNKQLHATQVSLLQQRYGAKIDEIKLRQQRAKAEADDAGKAYFSAKQRFDEEHGGNQ